MRLQQMLLCRIGDALGVKRRILEELNKYEMKVPFQKAGGQHDRLERMVCELFEMQAELTPDRRL